MSMGAAEMEPLFTQEQAKAFIKRNKLKDGQSLEDAFYDQIKGYLQGALEAEMDEELGYTKYDLKNKNTPNTRNGHSKKTLRSRSGDIELQVPRDSNGEFEPVIVKKHERSLNPSLAERIIRLYAKGLSTRDIGDMMRELYGVEVSAEMVSRITDKVLPLAREWQSRPLDPMYAIVYLDGIMYNVQDEGQTTKKTVYLVYGVNVWGKKDVLGIWVGEAESAKFWLKVLMDLKNRGVKDILISAVDGLKGFKEAIESAYPQTEVQQCIVHQVRNSTKFVNYKDRKEFCNDMKAIYTAPTEQAGLDALDRFAEKWEGKYAYAVKSWRTNWPSLSTFYRYPPEIRRMMYTTNAVENLNRRLRKVTKTKGVFPSEEALFKMLYLIIVDASEKWTLPLDNWGSIIQQLRAYNPERIDQHILAAQ